jgi:arginine:pyruvate transaminase
MYVTYEATVQAPGATLVPVVLDADNGFRLRREALEAAVSERTRAIFYASPSNPTGIALNDEELGYIAEVAQRHDLWVVADEVYGDFVFEGEFRPTASMPGLDDRLITIGSLSKSYAMSGWRVGWAVAPPAMVENMDKLALCMLYGLPGFIQQAAQHALENCRADLERMREIYRQRLHILHAAFTAMPGLSPLMPDAGMFMLVDVRGTGLEVSEFTGRLYESTGVSLLDATAFGESAAGHVRVSATASDAELEDAIGRIRGFVEGL